MSRLTAVRRRKIVARFQAGVSTRTLAYYWACPITRIEAVLRAVLKKQKEVR